MDGLESDNSNLTICALELDSSIFSALELHHSKLRTCVQELNNSRWGALELDYSNRNIYELDLSLKYKVKDLR